MKILIVKLSALGDVIHALPVLAYLHSVVPEAEVDWLVEESFAPLLDSHPLINSVISAATKRWRKEGPVSLLKGVRTLSARFRDERYDLVLDLQGNSKSGFFTWLTRSPRRYGFARDGVREWPNLLATHNHVPLQGAHHVSERSLMVARSAFPGSVVDLPLAGPLSVDPSARSSVVDGLAAKGLKSPLVVCHFGTTWKTKLWPVNSWQKLLAKLDQEGCHLVLTWGNQQERVVIEGLVEAVPAATIWPRGSLQELIALLAEADLVVGGDTGPVHLAAAVGTSTVSWYRVTDAERNGPRGANHVRLQAPLDCSPCLRKECERDGECGESITVEQVVAAARKLLAGAVV